MTTEEQAAWDEERAERIAARDEADALDKENAGYDDMSNDAKAVYDAEYLTWKKAWFKVCQEEPDSIECRKGREVRDADEVARKADGYYEKEKADRDTFDETQESETEKEKNALAVAWLDDNKPAAELDAQLKVTAAVPVHQRAMPLVLPMDKQLMYAPPLPAGPMDLELNILTSALPRNSLQLPPLCSLSPPLCEYDVRYGFYCHI